jgi:hypothetical protein
MRSGHFMAMNSPHHESDPRRRGCGGERLAIIVAVDECRRFGTSTPVAVCGGASSPKTKWSYIAPRARAWEDMAGADPRRLRGCGDVDDAVDARLARVSSMERVIRSIEETVPEPPAAAWSSCWPSGAGTPSSLLVTPIAS